MMRNQILERHGKPGGQYFPKNDAWQYPDRAGGACTVWCIEFEHLTGKYEGPAQKA
jgi:hypothetical protein